MSAMRHTSHIHVGRRRGGGWVWVLLYMDQPEASGWERTKTAAVRAAHLAQRTLALILKGGRA